VLNGRQHVVGPERLGDKVAAVRHSSRSDCMALAVGNDRRTRWLFDFVLTDQSVASSPFMTGI
jgi:hypothetical protein